MNDIKVNYDKTFSTKHTRDYYRGKSFHFSGDWKTGVHYCNDIYHVDFITIDNVLLVCAKSHTSTQENKPIDFIRDESGNIIGINSMYWDVVISGKDGKVITIDLCVEIRVTSGSTVMRPNTEADLEAAVYKNGHNITERIIPSFFSWRRTSRDAHQDEIWNIAHEGYGNTVHITSQDVIGSCTFSCVVYISDIETLTN